tara:strand:- start:2962 stop:4647 length:1686 start_codon:yes stop_codon:yes gene_type:complete
MTYWPIHCVTLILSALLCLFGNALTGHAQDVDLTWLHSDLNNLARLTGQPAIVSAGGLTKNQTQLLTIENLTPYSASTRRRIVIVAGLDGKRESAQLAINAVRWFKLEANDELRRSWDISAMVLANPTSHMADNFPPAEHFFNDPERPDTRYIWRWVAYQAPDLVVELTAGDTFQIEDIGQEGTLSAALSSLSTDSELGSVPVVIVTGSARDGERVIREILARAPESRSQLRTTIDNRVERRPLELARLLAEQYPGTPSMSYIPGVAWVHTLRLATLLSNSSLRAKVIRDVQPWLSGEESITGERISFAGLAGTMVFSELAKTPGLHRETAEQLAAEGVALAAQESEPGRPDYGSGWSDDVFLGTIAATTAQDGPGMEAAVRLITRYANQLQQPSGLWHHAPDSPIAWGRGNGFAAAGLAETLTALPSDHSSYSTVLNIYRRHMEGLRLHQAPDGMWRQVIDLPGSYRETSVTALTLTAMARGIRYGWLDQSFQTVVTRAWRGLLAHIEKDGTLVDVCISTGAGPTLSHYLDRTAIQGFDDRGGALALGAALEMHALLATP